jgi:hypothetical protein
LKLFFAETDLNSTEQVNEDNITPNKDDPIRPLERKAINFLVNEYYLPGSHSPQIM